MNSANDADVIVIGGGISGLACAWNLQSRGLRALVLEARGQVGGCIATTRDHGCLIEAGPNGALDTTPLIAQLLQQLGIAESRVEANPPARNRYILRQGRLIALPLSPLGFIGSRLFSPRAKLRLLAEPFIPAAGRASDESVAAFVTRRLGPEFLEYAIDPFVAGIYAGDPEVLSVKSAFPRLHQIEQTYGSLIRGQILGGAARDSTPEKSKAAAAMFSFRDGMQTLTMAIADKLARIETATRAVEVTRGAACYRIAAVGEAGQRTFRTRALVLATPAYVASDLVSALAPAAGAALAGVPYPPVAVVASAYPKTGIKHALDGFGMLIPRIEHRKSLGTIFSSTLFRYRAPDDKALLTTFVGGARQQDLAKLNERELALIVEAEHAALLGTRVRPDFVNVRQWQRAIPQYTVGHAGRMEAVDSAEALLPGLFFCANYRGGVAIGDCVKSASATASRVELFLRERGDR